MALSLLSLWSLHLANKTIDQLDASSGIASGDNFPLASSGSDTLKRATVNQLVTYVQAQTGPQNQALINLMLMGY